MTKSLEAAQLLAEFRHRRDRGTLNAEQVEHDAQRVADLVIAHHREAGGYLRDAVTLLCEITSHEDQSIARVGVNALFPDLIERLNDSFDPAACKLYDRIFAQVIDYYRHLPQATEFDEALRGFGLMNESDLLRRKSSILNTRPSSLKPQASIFKVLLLSRITIGADVAITSVIIARLRALLPRAEFVLLGPAKLRELFGGDLRLQIREISYERGAGVLSRLISWTDVVEAVKEETSGLTEDEFCLIDPDSRLTQLGLLPLLINEQNYLFFESRSYQLPKNPEPQSIGRLTSLWLNDVLGVEGQSHPYVALLDEYLSFGRKVVSALRRGGASHIIAISLGVGGNQRKRVSDEFEMEMVNSLIAGSTLIIDKGGTEEERDQINRIITSLRNSGFVIVEINEENRAEMISEEMIEADAITWDGGIGSFAGLIADSDRYIGYDSAGQHIAAAIGVPTLTIFVNSGSTTFAERWRPYGKGDIKILSLDQSSSWADVDLNSI